MPFCRPSSSMTEINSRFIAHSPATAPAATLHGTVCSCRGDRLRYGLKRHDAPCFSDRAELKDDRPLRTRIVHHDRDSLIIHFRQHSDHTPLSIDWLPELHAHLLPQCPAIILNPFEGP